MSLWQSAVPENGLHLDCGWENLTIYSYDYNWTMGAYYCGIYRGEYEAKHRKSNAASSKDTRFTWICLVILAVNFVF